MSENKVEILFGVDASELLATMQRVSETVTGALKSVNDRVSESAASASDATARMKQAFEPLSDRIGASNDVVIESEKRVEEATESLASKIQESLEEAGDNIKSSFDDLAGSIKKVQSVFSAMAAVLAGGSAFKDAITASQRWTGEIVALSKAMGNTTQQASGLNAALRLNGLESNEYISMSMRMLMAVRSNGDELERQGFKWRQAGNDQAAMFQLALRWIGEATSGVDRNSRAQLVFARSAMEAEKYQKLTNKALDEGTQWAIEHGLVVGRDEVEAYKAQNKQLNEMCMNLDQLQILIGKSVLPAIQDTVKSLKDLASSPASSAMNQLLLWMSQARPSNLVPNLDATKATEAFERYKKEIEASRQELAALDQAQSWNIYKIADLRLNIVWQTMSLEALRKEMEAAGQDTSRLDAYLVALKQSGDNVSKSQAEAASNVKNVGDQASAALMGLDEFKKRLLEIGSINLDNLHDSISSSIEGLRIRIQVAESGIDPSLQAIEVSYRERLAEINKSRAEAQRSNASQEVHSRLDAEEAELEIARKLALRYKEIQDAQREAHKPAGGSGSGGGESIVQAWRTELNEMIAASRAAGQDTKVLEKQFWDSKVAAAQKGSKEYSLALQESNRLAKELSQQEHKQREEIAKITEESERRHAEAMSDIEADRIRTMKQLGEISAEDEIRALAQIGEQKYQMELQALRDRLQIRELEPIEIERINAQIKAIEDRRNAAMAASTNKLKVEEDNRWKAMARSISGTMTNAVTAMLQGTQSLANGLKSIWNQIAAHIIGKIIETTVQFLANEIRKTVGAWAHEGSRTAAAAYGATARDGIQDASAAKGLATSAATGMKSIFNDAKRGAAGAYAALAEIPIVGPALGAAAAAVVFAAIMAFGTLTSAAGGWSEVPSDQLAMVHKSEMVLPAHLAQAIRDMANPAAAIAQAVNLAVSSALGSASPLASASTILRSGLTASLAPALSIAANGPAMVLSGIGSYGIPADKLTFTRAVLSGGLSFGSAGAATAATARGRGGDVTVSNPTFNFPSNLADLVKGNPNALYRGIRDGVKRGHITKRSLRR